MSRLCLDVFTSTIPLLLSLNVTMCRIGTLCTGGLPPAIGPRDPHPGQLPAGRAALLTDWAGGGRSLWSLTTCIGPPEQRLTNLAACDNRHVFSHSSRGSTSESRCGQGHICRQARGQGSSLASGRPWSPLAYMYYFNLCL